MKLRHPALPPAASRPWIYAALLAWVVSIGVTALTAPEPMPPGMTTMDGTLLTDFIPGRYGSRAIVATGVGKLLVEMEQGPEMRRGSRVRLEGTPRGEPGRLGTHRYRARLSVEEISPLSGSVPSHIAMGDAVREHVMARLGPLDSGRALLAGFLIGDTDGLKRSDLEAMRLAGLSHFVAVSGSNVALFVALLAFVAGPLALGPKPRALVGLIGLPIYAAATRFEPSVMRASVMAALALGGRLAGIVMEAWQLLSAAVVVLLVFEPSLTGNPGFQLSVAATAGVLIGGRWPVPRGPAWRALAVTLGAQLAVAPLLLVHFGSVPLMSPVANLAAAPLVAASTVVGAVGVVGPEFLLSLGSRLADVVLFMARGTVSWPQLGPGQFGAVVGLALLMSRMPRLRAPALVVGLTALVVSLSGMGRSAPDNSVVVLDVGQGDAILIHGGSGRYALVDGGPDQVRLLQSLREYAVSHLELVVLTHVHADHASGLRALPGVVGIDELWTRATPHQTADSRAVLEAAKSAGVRVMEPEVGRQVWLGELEIVVEAPRRRYASPNDQSIVLTVHGPLRTMLLAGDIEQVAQSELTGLRADVLKVPHQGADTSDPDWLRAVGADLAIISVGPNQFGHPSPRVIDALEGSGADLRRTDRDGDVVVPLG